MKRLRPPEESTLDSIRSIEATFNASEDGKLYRRILKENNDLAARIQRLAAIGNSIAQARELRARNVAKWREQLARLPFEIASGPLIIDFEASGQGMLPPLDCGKRIASLPVKQTVFVRGNHEHNNWYDFSAAWHGARQKLTTLHGEAFVYGPLVIVGFPCLLGDEDAFRGDRPMLEVDPNTWLRPLLKKLGPAMRTLWLMHEPPRGTPLAPESGVIAGYREWMEAVEWFAPKLVVFGHDHTTSRRKKIWNHKLPCGTVCINVGQDAPLRYTVLEMTFCSEKPSLPTAIQVTANVDKRETLRLSAS